MRKTADHYRRLVFGYEVAGSVDLVTTEEIEERQRAIREGRLVVYERPTSTDPSGVTPVYTEEGPCPGCEVSNPELRLTNSAEWIETSDTGIHYFDDREALVCSLNGGGVSVDMYLERIEFLSIDGSCEVTDPEWNCVPLTSCLYSVELTFAAAYRKANAWDDVPPLSFLEPLTGTLATAEATDVMPTSALEGTCRYEVGGLDLAGLGLRSIAIACDTPESVQTISVESLAFASPGTTLTNITAGVDLELKLSCAKCGIDA